MKLLLFILSILICNNLQGQISDFDTLNFSKADLIAKNNLGADLENLPLLSYNLTSNLTTDVEKFRAIYMWVCENIKNDPNQNKRISRKRRQFKNDSIGYLSWNKIYLKEVYTVLQKKKKTSCFGYAYLIKELSNLAGLECTIVNGYGRNAVDNTHELNDVNHSWNAVKLNNKWYLCDATWGSGYNLESVFIHDLNEGYFLPEPKLFAMNHYPSEKKWLLDNSLINSDYHFPPVVYSELFRHYIVPILPENLINYTNEETIYFSFQVFENFNENSISLIYFSGEKEVPLNIIDLKKENGIISFQTQLKTKMNYDIHLKINNETAATYVIKRSI